ncbi:hypothetical protein ABIC08_006465 [Bradyrhizobium sp. RT9b]
MVPAAEMRSTLRMSTATLRDENERLKALLAQTQAALSEHQAALATSEEARRRLEVILGELRREKFARSPRSCGQINIICRSKTWRSRKASWMRRRRRRRRSSGADRAPDRIKTVIAIGVACLLIASGEADHRACEHALSVRLRRHDEDRRGH